MIFLLMSVIVAVGLLALPPEDKVEKGGEAKPPLPISNVLAVAAFSAGLASIVWGIEHIQEWGAWSDVRFRLHVMLGMSVILLAGLHQWQKRDALLPLAMLSKPKYIGILLSSAIMGVVVYGFLYLIPYYLIRVHGAGVAELFQVTLYASFPQLIWLPVVLFLRNKVSPYVLVMFGALMGTFSVWQLTGLGMDFGGTAWMLPQGIRAISIPIIVMPLGLLLITLPSKEDAPALTSLYSLFRSLGGIVGVSGLTAFTEARQSYYTQIIIMNKTDSSPLSLLQIERSGWLYAFNDTFLLVSTAMMGMCFYFGYLAWQHYRFSRESIGADA
jgi:DHA2 family multidrug resistance protein